MKKITLLFILITSFSFGQVVLSEDFEAGLTLPTGWTNNDIQGGGDIWAFSDTGQGVKYSDLDLYYNFGGCSGIYAHFDSDGYGENGAENAALESPAFDCSLLTQVTLTFNHFFEDGYGGAGFVEVFNGTSWVEVDNYGAAIAYGFTSYDVSTELAGVSNAQVRFRWTGDWAWAWAVDNVSVFQCTVNAPDIATVSAPADGAIDVPITYGGTNSVGPFEWTDATTGDPADSYIFNLGITTAGNDIGSLPFESGGDILYDFQPNTQYYWSVDAVNCAGTTPGTIWSFTTAACTELNPPTAVTSPVPANLAAGIPIAAPDGLLNFSWTAGDPGDTFVLNFGTSIPPSQSFPFENGDPLFGLAENTTYFWSVDAINCAGTTVGPIWSFTTGTLSVESTEIETFKIFPNPVKDYLNIDTSLTIESIALTNLLGKQVLMLNGSSISNNRIDLSNFSNGLYILQINAIEKSQTFKIIKE